MAFSFSHDMLEHKMQLKPFISLNQAVYELLVEHIISLDLVQDQQIVATKIASELIVSRTPVTNAINMLLDEGFFFKDDKGHVLVSHLERKTVNELIAARSAIEEEAISAAAAMITPSGLKKLKKLLSDFARSEETQDAYLMARTDERFHDVIVQESRNPFLISAYETLRKHLRQWRMLYFFSNNMSNEMTKRRMYYEHKAAYEILSMGNVSKDGKIARAWMRHHLQMVITESESEETHSEIVRSSLKRRGGEKH